MGLTKNGSYYYSTNQRYIRDELLRFSQLNEYIAERFADAICNCGNKTFFLAVDDNEGVSVRTCCNCGRRHPIGDSDEFLEEAVLESCECPCGHQAFELTVGVALYTGTDDVKWIYLGCRCSACGITAVYGHWKNEYSGFEELLSRV